MAFEDHSYENTAVGASVFSQKAATDRAIVVQDPHPRGTRSVRVMVKAGDLVANGTRSEWTKTFSPPEKIGTSYFYGFSVYIPDGTDPWGRGDPRWESGPNWGILWQLHHPQGTGSPPFGLFADRQWSSSNPIRMGLDIRGGGTATDGIGVNGKTKNVITLHQPLPVGKWIDVICRVRWAADTSGSVQCWTRVRGIDTDFVQRINNTALKTCSTDFDSGSAYWKGGIYCDKGDLSVPTRVVYNNGMGRGASFQEVVDGMFAGAATGGGGTTPPPPSIPLPPDAERFGTLDGGTTMAAANSDRTRSSVYTLDRSRNAQSLKAYLDGLGGTTGSAQIRGVIYTAGGALVAASSEVNIPSGAAGAWVDLPIPAGGVNLDAGQYRLGLLSGGAPVARYAIGTDPGDMLQWAVDTYADGPMGTWDATDDPGKRLAVYAVTQPPTGTGIKATGPILGSGTARLTQGGTITVPITDVQWRIRPEIMTPANLAAARVLAQSGIRVVWPQEATRISTGERLTARASDGAYIPTTTT